MDSLHSESHIWFHPKYIMNVSPKETVINWYCPVDVIHGLEKKRRHQRPFWSSWGRSIAEWFTLSVFGSSAGRAVFSKSSSSTLYCPTLHPLRPPLKSVSVLKHGENKPHYSTMDWTGMWHIDGCHIHAKTKEVMNIRYNSIENADRQCIKLKCRQSPAIDTNYSCSNCTISN